MFAMYFVGILDPSPNAFCNLSATNSVIFSGGAYSTVGSRFPCTPFPLLVIFSWQAPKSNEESKAMMSYFVSDKTSRA